MLRLDSSQSGEEGFLDLAVKASLIVEEQVFRQLLGNGRAALDHGIGAQVFRHGARKSEEINAEMVEEAAVFGCEDRLDDMVRQLVNGHGAAMQDTALANLVAVAVKERHGEIVARAPVLFRLVKGRDGQRQHDHGTDRAPGECFAKNFENRAPPAGDMEAAEEDGGVFPEFGKAKAQLVKGRIDPGIKSKQRRDLESLAFLAGLWLVPSNFLPALCSAISSREGHMV